MFQKKAFSPHCSSSVYASSSQSLSFPFSNPLFNLQHRRHHATTATSSSSSFPSRRHLATYSSSSHHHNKHNYATKSHNSSHCSSRESFSARPSESSRHTFSFAMDTNKKEEEEYNPNCPEYTNSFGQRPSAMYRSNDHRPEKHSTKMPEVQDHHREYKQHKYIRHEQRAANRHGSDYDGGVFKHHERRASSQRAFAQRYAYDYKKQKSPSSPVSPLHATTHLPELQQQHPKPFRIRQDGCGNDDDDDDGDNNDGDNNDDDGRPERDGYHRRHYHRHRHPSRLVRPFSDLESRFRRHDDQEQCNNEKRPHDSRAVQQARDKAKSLVVSAAATAQRYEKGRRQLYSQPHAWSKTHEPLSTSRLHETPCQLYPLELQTLILHDGVVGSFHPQTKTISFENAYVSVQPYGIIAMPVKRDARRLWVEKNCFCRHPNGMIVPRTSNTTHLEGASVYAIKWTRSVHVKYWDELVSMTLCKDARFLCASSPSSPSSSSSSTQSMINTASSKKEEEDQYLVLPPSIHLGKGASLLIKNTICLSRNSSCTIHQESQSSFVYRFSRAVEEGWCWPDTTITTWHFNTEHDTTTEFTQGAPRTEILQGISCAEVLQGAPACSSQEILLVETPKQTLTFSMLGSGLPRRICVADYRPPLQDKFGRDGERVQCMLPILLSGEGLEDRILQKGEKGAVRFFFSDGPNSCNARTEMDLLDCLHE